VRLVTPEVNCFTSPRIRLEKPWTLVTTEAAKAEPGKLAEERPPEDGTEAEGVDPDETGWKPGS